MVFEHVKPTGFFSPFYYSFDILQNTLKHGYTNRLLMNWHVQRNCLYSPWLSYMSKTWQMKQLCLKQNTIARSWHFHIGMFYITLNHYSKSFFHLIYINSSLYIRSVLPALGTSHCCRLSNSVRNFLHCHGNGAVSYDRTHSIGIVDLSQDWAVVVSTEHARPQQLLDLMDRSRMTITGVPHYTVDGVSYQSVKIYIAVSISSKLK